ncbi:MAG TPA: transcription elongation protein SprT [Roseiarcus sp.]
MFSIIPHADSGKRDRAASSQRRHAWLEAATAELRSRFAGAGYSTPDNLRVSLGWPKRAGACGAIGECWAPSASSDQYFEMFVSPAIGSGVEIIGTLTHELVHASVGVATGHRAPFKRCAHMVGLKGPMRATVIGVELGDWIDDFIHRAGPYPSGFLTDSKKQTTRGLRCECQACGYLARVSRKWLDLVGPPICPTDLEPMVMTAGDAP